MNEAVYRIDVFRSSLMPDPFPWKAHVRRLSDDEMVAAGVGITASEALEMARELVERMNADPYPSTVYVDENGRDATSHSARV